jgi:mitochondrial fission protein ELM1
LIGGNSGAYRYRQKDWLQLTGFLRDAHRSHGIRWLATTSRRSGSSSPTRWRR